MKKNLLVLLSFITLTGTSFSQDRYIVFFTDKNNSPFQVGNPSAFLSQRAINRRVQHNVAVTALDLPVNPSYVAGIIAQGGDVLNVSKWFNSATVRITNNSILNNISGLPYVSQVLQAGRIAGPSPVPGKFQNVINSLAEVIPNNSNNRRTSFSYGSSLNQVEMLNGVLMHDNGYTGTGMRIAVIDAGFYNADLMVAFDSIRQSNRILGTWDFVEGEMNVYDDDWHGSMVLSTIASNVPGEIIGTAPGASYYL
jgi:subtilisin family serine protease